MSQYGRNAKPVPQTVKPTRTAHEPQAQDLDPVRATVVPNKGRNASGVATVLDPRRPSVERPARKAAAGKAPAKKGLLEQALGWVRPRGKTK